MTEFVFGKTLVLDIITNGWLSFSNILSTSLSSLAKSGDWAKRQCPFWFLNSEFGDISSRSSWRDDVLSNRGILSASTDTLSYKTLGHYLFESETLAIASPTHPLRCKWPLLVKNGRRCRVVYISRLHPCKINVKQCIWVLSR